MADIRDRVKELRRVPASSLTPHPSNWRTHPDDQRRAMRLVLEKLGFAGAVLAVERDGGLLTCDGHLRSEEMGDREVPVLVLDLDDREVEELLVTYDPLAALAGSDRGRLGSLLQGLTAQGSELGEALKRIAKDHDIKLVADEPLEVSPPDEFKSVDEDIETQYCCPRCSFRWSGNPNAENAAADSESGGE